MNAHARMTPDAYAQIGVEIETRGQAIAAGDLGCGEAIAQLVALTADAEPAARLTVQGARLQLASWPTARERYARGAAERSRAVVVTGPGDARRLSARAAGPLHFYPQAGA